MRARTPHFSRATAYLRRLRRGLRILHELGRSELFRLENRIEIARVDYEQRDVYLRLDSRYSATRVRACAKEPWTVAWLERLEPGAVLWDVGANTGAYALLAAALHPGQVAVVAVEPSYASYASLCDNIVLNELADSVTPLPVRLADGTGMAPFSYRSLEAGAALHGGETLPLAGDSAAIYRQSMLTYRLDDLLAAFDLPRPTHLKVDVDGGEAAVLRGAGAALASGQVQSVLAEVNRADGAALQDVLTGFEFVLDERHDPPSPHGHWYGVFTRRANA